MASGTSWSNILPASDAIYAGTGGIYFMLEGYCAYSSAYDLGNYHSWDDVQCPPDDSKCENMVKYNVSRSAPSLTCMRMLASCSTVHACFPAFGFAIS